jgi:hypothetical protein
LVWKGKKPEATTLKITFLFANPAKPRKLAKQRKRNKGAINIF